MSTEQCRRRAARAARRARILAARSEPMVGAWEKLAVALALLAGLWSAALALALAGV